ncbi:MAG TPA: hypothetical protein DCG49_05640 [Ruminococcus sp.]|nr:hypothetical protein [Ruminococcus sp.]
MNTDTMLTEQILRLLTDMRTENRFDPDLWAEIVRLLEAKIPQWKQTGQVPFFVVPYLTELSASLAGGSRFFDAETACAVEDASIFLTTELLLCEEPEET